MNSTTTLPKTSPAAAACLLLLFCAACATAPPAQTPAPSPTPFVIDEQKKEYELKKLQEEVAGLRISNEALDARAKWATTWLTALGGIVVTILAAIIGYLVNRTQKRKLVQDKRLGREEHLLKVFRDLGDEKARVRVGAVAVLVQRLTDLTEKRRRAECRRPLRWWRVWRLDEEEQKEAPTIVSVLISVSKHEKNVDIQKYIADGIAKGLFAILDAPQKDKKVSTPPRPKDGESPLRKYDFQRAQFQNAWWYSIDARGVDFYKANLSRAGLRRSLLSKAILKNADLTKATLAAADLTGADLSGASLNGANLRGAILDGANIKGTKFGTADVTGVDFGVTLNWREADLSRAVGYTPPPAPPP